MRNLKTTPKVLENYQGQESLPKISERREIKKSGPDILCCFSPEMFADWQAVSETQRNWTEKLEIRAYQRRGTMVFTVLSQLELPKVIVQKYGSTINTSTFRNTEAWFWICSITDLIKEGQAALLATCRK